VRFKESPVSEGRVLVLCAGGLWSLGGVFIKSLDLHPLTIVFYRSFFAALLFLPCVRARHWQARFSVLISALSYTAAVSTFVWANKLTTAANAIVLQYTAPIFVFLFARVLFGEPVSRRNLIALLAGMAGIGVIFGASRALPDAPGVTMAVVSGFLFAVYMTNLRFVQQISPAFLTWINNLVCCLVLFPFARSGLALSLAQTVSLAAMGVVQLGIPYFLFSKGLERISLQEASLIVLVEPVLNPIWVALTVGETPSSATLAGGAMILFGLGYRYFQQWARSTRSFGRDDGEGRFRRSH
jgi:drug/metabolite transporter, DME family